MSRIPTPANIATDPIGAVLILTALPVDTASPAILLRADGSATALHAIPGADGVWSLAEPIEQLTPEKVRQCFLGMRAIRREATQEIERLIALLDRLSPDPDFEEQGDNDDDPSQDEPSLGSVDNFTDQTRWAAGGCTGEHDVDAEGEHDGSEPDEDGEPTMGWSEDGSGGGGQDGEAEPSLGSFDRMFDQSKSWRQTDSYHYHSYDAEDDRSDREPDENPATLNVR